MALALCLLGCDSVVLPWNRVVLLTSSADTLNADGSNVFPCILMGRMGELIVDPKTGTALDEGAAGVIPVMWPYGFTGRRVGSEVEVLDRDENVVATTGKTYEVFYTYERLIDPGEVLPACGNVSPTR